VTGRRSNFSGHRFGKVHHAAVGRDYRSA